MAYLDAVTRLGLGGGPAIQYPGFAAAPATAAVTGTATDGITEKDIVAGGLTIIITLSNDTWVASGATFNAQRQNIIDGLDSAQSETTGWNNEVRDQLDVGQVVRTSDTVVTITLTAFSAYDITDPETITVTVPATAVTGGSAITASPTFSVDPAAAVTGRIRKRRRYVAEVEGEFFVFDSIHEVQAFLLQVREEADTAAEQDVTTPVAPKPPRVTVKTGTGKATTSKTLQQDVRRTQKTINRAYQRAAQLVAKRLEIDREISQLMHRKLEQEDEDDAILALLL